EVDRVHTCGVEPEPLDNPVGDPVADHDHAVSAPCGGVVRQTAEEALTAREESGQVEVLDVEEGQHGRPPGGRHGDGERVVDDVGALEIPSRRSRPEPGAPHRAEPPRRRRRGTVSRGDDGPEPVAGVRRERGHERLVLVLPDPREKARELSRVPLAAPRDTRDEREHAERDAGHVRGSSRMKVTATITALPTTTRSAHFECDATPGTARKPKTAAPAAARIP